MDTSSAPIRLEPLPPRRMKPPEPPAMRLTGALAPKPAKKRSKARRPASLAELRERRGVTLHEIANRTRIPLRHLEELERGDVSHWPAGVYARSWARDYAREAGIDPDRVTAFIAPVADVDVSPDEIRKARSLDGRVTVGGFEFPIDPELLKRIATVALVMTVLVLAALYLSRGGGSDGARRQAPDAVGTSGVTSETPRR